MPWKESVTLLRIKYYVLSVILRAWKKMYEDFLYSTKIGEWLDKKNKRHAHQQLVLYIFFYRLLENTPPHYTFTPLFPNRIGKPPHKRITPKFGRPCTYFRSPSFIMLQIRLTVKYIEQKRRRMDEGVLVFCLGKWHNNKGRILLLGERILCCCVKHLQGWFTTAVVLCLVCMAACLWKVLMEEIGCSFNLCRRKLLFHVVLHHVDTCGVIINPFPSFQIHYHGMIYFTNALNGI